MAKKSQKPQKKSEVVSQEKEKSTPVAATSSELITKVASLLKEHGAVGYVCAAVGSDAKILPYVGAASIGDLLTIKYVVEKEIARVIEGSSKTGA